MWITNSRVFVNEALFFRIMPTSPALANSPGGFYYAGTPDGSRAGIYYLNTANLDTV